MEKIKVKDTRTGKIVEITRNAFEQLKAGGHAKYLDVIKGITVKTIEAQVQPENEEEDSSSLSAKDLIEKIREAGSIAEVNALLVNESRVSVLKAAQKKKADLE